MWSVTGPDGTVATGWFLVPLRLFLGITFFYAGLQKLANPQFLDTTSPTSIRAQLVGAARSSPIHALISHLVPISSAVGLVIAVGEVAIGVGVVVGLLMRVAAVAGMALSFGLFLTVSFHSSPYFTGSDIVFFFAWTPLALAGAAGAPAVDTWLANRQPGLPARPGALPRRAVLSAGAVTGVVAAFVVVTGGVTAAVGRLVGGTSTAAGGGGAEPLSATPTSPTTTAASGSPTTTAASGSPTTTAASGSPTTTAGAAPSGTAIGPSSGVPVGGSATFTDPASGDPSLVIQRTAGDFVAFDAICPHAGCTVAYQRSAQLIACPCHGSEFDAGTGDVIRGPATRGLTPISVTKGSDGDLFVPG
jgi:thiosulfate dehydrogenase [quinone] large subunit